MSSAFCPWVGSIALLSFNALCMELTSVQVFSTFEDLGISVDVVASISLTLDPSKLWSRELIQQVFRVLRTNGVNVQMISQGASKIFPE